MFFLLNCEDKLHVNVYRGKKNNQYMYAQMKVHFLYTYFIAIDQEAYSLYMYFFKTLKVNFEFLIAFLAFVKDLSF